MNRFNTNMQHMHTHTHIHIDGVVGVMLFMAFNPPFNFLIEIITIAWSKYNVNTNGSTFVHSDIVYERIAAERKSEERKKWQIATATAVANMQHFTVPTIGTSLSSPGMLLGRRLKMLRNQREKSVFEENTNDHDHLLIVGDSALAKVRYQCGHRHAIVANRTMVIKC